MKAVVIAHRGAQPKEWQLVDRDIPKITHGEVLIKVAATSLNPVDFKLAQNDFSFPRVVGLDVAGVVHQVNDNEKIWKVGDRVSAHLSFKSADNGYAEYCVARSDMLVCVPDAVSFEDAAAVPCAGWTAYLALHHRMKVEKGKTIVVTAASGGVGGFAVQLAKQAGLKVIATARKANEVYVKSLGADFVIDYTVDKDIAAKVIEIDGGCDYWLDNVGQASCDAALKALRYDGHLAVVVSGPTLDLIPPMIYKCQSIHNVMLGIHYGGQPEAQQLLPTIGQTFIGLLSQGRIKSLVNTVISLKDVPEALQKMQDGAGAFKGKTVVKF